MLVGLGKKLVAGDTLPLSLTFEHAGTVELEVPIKGMGDSMSHEGHQPDQLRSSPRTVARSVRSGQRAGDEVGRSWPRTARRRSRSSAGRTRPDRSPPGCSPRTPPERTIAPLPPAGSARRRPVRARSAGASRDRPDRAPRPRPRSHRLAERRDVAAALPVRDRHAGRQRFVDREVLGLEIERNPQVLAPPAQLHQPVRLALPGPLASSRVPLASNTGAIWTGR